MSATRLDKLLDRLPIWNASENRHDESVIDEVLKLERGYFDFGGQFLLDPNEFNGWGTIGVHDNTNTQDLGNINTTPSAIAGGFSRPFPFRVTQIFGWIRENNTTIVDAWGFRMFRQTKTDNSSVRTSIDILNEVADNGGVGPRDYANTNPQRFSLDLSNVPNNIVQPEEVLGFGVESPDAIATNRFIQFMTGWIEYERV